MTAHDQMRAMLDQLMGTARNGKILFFSHFRNFFIDVRVFSGENSSQVKFSDSRVCKSFLVGCCPHDILATTVSISFHLKQMSPILKSLKTKKNEEILSLT
jgi:hypothetical protein